MKIMLNGLDRLFGLSNSKYGREAQKKHHSLTLSLSLSLYIYIYLDYDAIHNMDLPRTMN
jgi:hypothetical protein